MNESRMRHRGAPTAWDGSGLAAAFAARRDRAWTLGYESVLAPVIQGSAAWEGNFPAELAGTFLRNGPARHERGGLRYAHRWDGDGMIQRFDLGPEGVTHLGRFVQTRKLTEEDSAGHMIYSGFGTPVDKLPPTADRIEAANPANINIVKFNGDYLALWEAGQPYLIDPETLATIGRAPWLSSDRPAPFSAHPKLAADGSLWNFGVDPLNNRLHLYGIARDVTAVLRRDFPVDQIAPMHDFGMTENFLIFLMPSIICDQSRLMAGASFAESCQWSPQLGMRAVVIRKTDGERIDFHLPPACLFHVANAWEEGRSICVDYLASRDPTPLMAGWSVMAGEYRHFKGASLTRATFDLDTGESHQQMLIDHDAEFPSVLAADVSHPYRQLLCLERSPSRPADMPGYDRLALIDVIAATSKCFDFGNDWLVEEHLVVAGADPHHARWALGAALDLRNKSTTILVFDTDDIAAGPIAQARLPYAVPPGLHGTFVARASA